MAFPMPTTSSDSVAILKPPRWKLRKGTIGRGLEPRLGQVAAAARRDERVAQETSDRHRADAARHRRDGAGDPERLGVSDIADEAALAGLSRYAVDADVDHRSARLHPVAAHESRAS